MGTQEVQKIIYKLIKGSQEIDRMRKEVDCLIKMTIGLIESYCHWEYYSLMAQKRESFFSPGPQSNSQYCWEVLIMPQSKRLEVKLLYIHEDESLCPEILYFAGGSFAGSISLDNVKIVYDALPVFVEGIVKIFPDLQHRWWKSLLDAAEVAEK